MNPWVVEIPVAFKVVIKLAKIRRITVVIIANFFGLRAVALATLDQIPVNFSS